MLEEKKKKFLLKSKLKQTENEFQFFLIFKIYLY